jgi:gamma-glutamylcyclotransferase (GGCT)/AIG2-like uncharacterized protein YtfP
MNQATESLDRPNALFVCGTLAPGQVNAHVLAPLSGAWTEVNISGSLHDFGWGAAHGCPGARLTDSDIDSIPVDSYPTSVVNGLLFESEELPDFWQTLDEFEGTEYQAEITTARLVTGEHRCCVVYTVLAG